MWRIGGTWYTYAECQQWRNGIGKFVNVIYGFHRRLLKFVFIVLCHYGIVCREKRHSTDDNGIIRLSYNQLKS